MINRSLVVAVCFGVCTGCQSTDLLSGRFGHDDADALTQIAEGTNDADLASPGLPPPTNRETGGDVVESSTSVQQFLRLGESELSQDRKLAAKRNFEKALALEPTHAKANHRMAVVCDKLAQYEQAERHYNKALDADPRNVAILSDLGYSYWLQGRYADSERSLLQARTVDPNYETAIANLGMLYGTTGRKEEAIAMFRKIGDEQQVQEIMQKVESLATRSAARPAVESEITQASFEVEAPSAPQAEVTANATAPVDASRPVNDQTRELLALMEQGRQRQQQAERSAPASQWAPEPQRPDKSMAQAAQQPGAGSQQPPVLGVDPFQSTAIPRRPAPTRPVPDHLLSEALAQIDREGRGVTNAPITIGPGSRSPQSLISGRAGRTPEASMAAAEAVPHQSTASNAEPMNVAQAIAEAKDTSLPGQPRTGAIDVVNGPQRRAAEFERAASNDQIAQTSAGRTDVEVAPSGIPASTSSAQLASAEIRNGSGIPDWAAQPVEHAHHIQRPGAPPPIDLIGARVVGATAADAGMSAATMDPLPGTARQPLAAASAGDAYQQARRQAAMLGLGVGPGQLFPYVEQVQRVAPGTNSRWNGAEYPAPGRALPATAAPADLHASFTPPQALELGAGQSFQGQALPTSPVAVVTPPPYRPGATTEAPQSSLGIQSDSTSGNPLARYDDVRQQQSSQLSGLINQTYGQSPQSPPMSANAPQSQLVSRPQVVPGPTVSGGQEWWASAPATSAERGRGTDAVQDEGFPRATGLSASVSPEPSRFSAGGMAIQPKPAQAAAQYRAPASPAAVPMIVPQSR